MGATPAVSCDRRGTMTMLALVALLVGCGTSSAPDNRPVPVTPTTPQQEAVPENTPRPPPPPEVPVPPRPEPSFPADMPSMLSCTRDDECIYVGPHHPTSPCCNVTGERGLNRAW